MAVSPLLFLMLISIPGWERSTLTQSTLPCLAARCRAVSPSYGLINGLFHIPHQFIIHTSCSKRKMQCMYIYHFTNNYNNSCESLSLIVEMLTRWIAINCKALYTTLPTMHPTYCRRGILVYNATVIALPQKPPKVPNLVPQSPISACTTGRPHRSQLPLCSTTDGIPRTG